MSIRKRRLVPAAIAVAGLLAGGAGMFLLGGAAPAATLAALRDVVVDRAVEEGAPALAAWIIQTRNSLADGAAPPPAAVQALLRDYFPQELLARVSYRIGWPPGPWGIAFRLTNARAITIDRVIVFRDCEMAADPVIWAHELTHVRQFDRWGVPGFARRYLHDRDGIEAEAWDVATNYKMWALAAGRL